MQEDDTNGLNANTTDPAVFETFVRQQLVMISATLERFDRDSKAARSFSAR
jgi:hypothetical protein